MRAARRNLCMPRSGPRLASVTSLLGPALVLVATRLVALLVALNAQHAAVSVRVRATVSEPHVVVQLEAAGPQRQPAARHAQRVGRPQAQPPRLQRATGDPLRRFLSLGPSLARVRGAAARTVTHQHTATWMRTRARRGEWHEGMCDAENWRALVLDFAEQAHQRKSPPVLRLGGLAVGAPIPHGGGRYQKNRARPQFF